MNEAFLQYVWLHQLLCTDKLFTTQNEPVQVIKIGTFNSNAGPDFLNAQIKIGNTLWVGDVEIHLKSSDWEHHKHQKQKSYNSVILHAVATFDKEIERENGTIIPTLVMPILPSICNNFKSLCAVSDKIKCKKHIPTIDNIKLSLFIERLVAERFENKAHIILKQLEINDNDWEETFYQQLSKYFGTKTNAEAFETLAKSLPRKLIIKHFDNPFQVSALLFGQANFWSKNPDEYELLLKKEFDFLKNKYNLSAISPTWWKFARMRPCNFPTIRLAQFIDLLSKTQSITSEILECTSIKELQNFFNIKADKYWETHYLFGKTSPKHKTNLGSQTINTIIINSVIPFLLAFGIKHSDEKYRQRAYDFLSDLPKENNKILDEWKNSGVTITSAYESQGYLQLYNNYCSLNNCIHCNIGHIVLNKQ